MKLKFKNTISVLIKRILNIFELSVLLLIFFFYLFRSYGVQTVITHQLTNYVNNELDIDVVIKGVKLKSFKNFELNEILIPDLYGDTIVYIPEIKIKLEQIKIINNLFQFQFVYFLLYPRQYRLKQLVYFHHN